MGRPAILNADQQQEVVRHLRNGTPKSRIAAQMGCSTWVIKRIADLFQVANPFSCASCRVPLVGKNTKFCSPNCLYKSKRKYDSCLACGSPLGVITPTKQVKYCEACYVGRARRTGPEIRRQRKQKLIDLKGGKCERCGYNRCLAALDFHHRDRSTKKFSLSGGNLTNRDWANITAELAKCNLLCSNCHRETEDELQLTRPPQSTNSCECRPIV